MKNNVETYHDTSNRNREYVMNNIETHHNNSPC